MLKVRRNKAAKPPVECSLSRCIRFLQGEWTANVLWYLRGGPRRFTELKRDLAGVSSKVLAGRLVRLRNDGLIVRELLATSPPSVEYRLTSLGEAVQPALSALVAVGERIKAGAYSNH